MLWQQSHLAYPYLQHRRQLQGHAVSYRWILHSFQEPLGELLHLQVHEEHYIRHLENVQLHGHILHMI